MNPVKEIKTTWQSIPSEVQLFLKRALIIFIIWKLIYHLFLFNGRVIDKPLTDWSTKGAEKILKVFYPQGKFMIKESCTIAPEFNNAILCSDVLILDKKKIIGVADICNGLELYVLYIGFLCAFPSSVIKKIVFILLGVFIIYFANVFRLVGLATMNLKQSNSIEMAHHYLFKMIVYTLIFVMWVLFARSQNKT